MPFGFHPMYLIVLLAIVLIIFGPGKLPQVGGAIGRGLREFQRTRDDLTAEVTSAVAEKPAAPAAPAAAGEATHPRSDA